MKCKDWNKSESDSWLSYQSGSMRNWGTGKLMGRSGIHGCLSLHFRSQFFQCSVCYIALHFFSVHFWKSWQHRLFGTFTGQPNQYCCQETSVSRESECINSSVAVEFFAAPPFSCFWAGFVFLDCTHRVRWNGVPSHSVLRSIPISFSANLLTRLQPFCGRKTISVCRQWACFLHLWPWPWCWAYPWVQLSCRIHFLVHRDFLGFLRVSLQLHHHRLWCGFGCLRLSWFWWMSDLA